MHDPAAAPTRAPLPHLPLAICLCSAVACAGLLFVIEGLRGEVRELRATVAAGQEQLAVLNGEVTRFRIEQRAEGRGIQALLEKLRTYAPLLANANIAQPYYEFAKKEMDAVMRALAGLGKDASGPVLARYLACNPLKDFDEMGWLLRGLLRLDAEAGKQLALKVLQGFHKDVPTSPRLRWFAADELLTADRAMAGRALHEILAYESARGIDRNRALAYGVTVPDTASVSSGFDNFIGRYVQSGDERIDDTLIEILGRAEHDLPTVQECVKYLGARKSAKAQRHIERLYLTPPVISDNPLFLNHCIDALAQIRGAEGIPWFEEQLKKAGNELVANKLKHTLDELRHPGSSPAPAANQPGAAK